MRHIKKKTAILAVAVFLTAGGGAAFGFWASQGSITGTDQTHGNVGGLTKQTLSVAQTNDPTVTPGTSAPILFTLSNAGAQAASEGPLTVTIGSIFGAPGTCSPAWFSVSPGAMNGGTVPAGGSDTDTTTPWQLNMVNNAVDETGCAGAQVDFSYSM